MADVSFGEWLKRRRGTQGWTQKQLAQQINCSISSLRKMEAEERRPSVEVIERLSEIFNIPKEEHKAFLRFARGDWQAISSADQEEAPWRVTPDPVETQIKSVTPRHNLPLQLNSFIGRTKEEAEIAGLITQKRLVTLTGVGGIGKTRLSIQTASALLDDFPNGVWFVELAPLSDSTLVAQTIVNTLGLLEQANRSPQIILTDFLQGKHALLILDNCEHLIQACSQLVERLLHTCPELHILATSREGLGIAGELAFGIPTLSFPTIDQDLSTETLTQYEAVQLFVQRATTVLPGFSIMTDNARALAGLCRQLDGIPLALELAAARVKLLRVEEIAARLDDRFHLLTGGSRTALPRHQTLQAMIDWSHDLLTEPERVLLRRLSVFAGGWTLEAAEAVCGDENIQKHEVLDLLTQLVNKSLALVEHQQGHETRYHMLETIRQYAHAKLWEAGEGELMRRQHLAYFVDLAERAEPNLRAFDMVIWLDRLEAELDNIRVALEYALEDDVESELRLTSALQWFWWIRGHKNEGIEWIEQGLSIESAKRSGEPSELSHAMIRGKALNVSGFWLGFTFEASKAEARLKESLAIFQNAGVSGKQGLAYALLRLGGLPSIYQLSGRTMLKQSLDLFRDIGDKFGMAECLLQSMGGVVNDDNDYKQGAVFTEESLALRREIGDLDGIATALAILGDLAFFSQDDYQKAIALYVECLAIFREVGNKWALGSNLTSYGDICLWQGNYEQATEILEEAVTFAREFGDKSLITFYFYSLGFIAWFRGNYAHARQLITDNLKLCHDIGYHWLAVSSLHALGDIALAQGDEEKATQWYEAEQAFSQETNLNEALIFAQVGLGKISWAQSYYEQATTKFEEALRISREIDFKQGTFHALYNLGRIAQLRGEHTTARAYYVEILEMQQQRIMPLFKWTWLKTYVAAISYPLEGLAILAATQNQMRRAIWLLGAAESLYVPLRYEMSSKERSEYDQAIATARAALGDEAFAAAYEEGKKMTLDEAVAYALEDTEARVG